MILTGNEIKKQVKNRAIIINPFNADQLNPNSYNYRLSDKLVCFDVKKNKTVLNKIKIQTKGYVLQPHKTYLASTYEVLGSTKYAMSLIGRSSLGRLGLFLQVSANLGHTGAVHKWTLELVSTKKFRIYPNMIIGQISFWINKGDLNPYTESYSKFNYPKKSKIKEGL